MMTAIAKSHGGISKFLHWVTGAMLVYGFFQNGDVTGALNDPSAMRIEVIFGLLLGAGFAARFAWMRHAGRTRLQEDAPKWEHRLSRLAHSAIYGAVAALVLSGLAIAFVAGGDPVLVEFVADIHIVIANLTVLLIGAHVAAAVWHKVVRRDGVLESMLPRPGRA